MTAALAIVTLAYAAAWRWARRERVEPVIYMVTAIAVAIIIA